MKLTELSAGIGELMGDGAAEVNVNHITHDSRTCQSGSLFVAIEGATLDGHRYIGCASQLGAVAVVTNKPDKVPCCMPIVVVENPRAAMAALSRRLYLEPDTKLCIVGITGTNGKTTGTYLTAQLLNPIGKTGRMGTLSYFNGITEERASRTTPESTDIYRMLAEMTANSCRYAAMEISSHGLAFGRVLGLQLRYALFSNLTQDHMDFHGDMQSYFEAKQKQFEHLVDGGVAVVNWDDASGRRMKIPKRARLIRYGSSPEADLRFEILDQNIHGSRFNLTYEGRTQEINLPLLGAHNVYNFAMAGAVALCEGRSLEQLATSARDLTGVPGRTEMLRLGQDYGVIVDFAHTPDALRNVLGACKAVNQGRLIVVFGAGGDRDHTKRPEMGLAVDECADVIYLTSDNPRTEDPEVIMDMVQAGMKRGPGPTFHRDFDRRRAIETALMEAESGDLVVIAGRGHETFQEIDGKRYPFDDRVVASTCIQARLERLSNV